MHNKAASVIARFNLLLYLLDHLVHNFLHIFYNKLSQCHSELLYIQKAVITV
jgi:hypothetical protein